MRTSHRRHVRGGLRPWDWGMEIKGNPRWSAAAHARAHLECKHMCALLFEIEREGTMGALSVAWSKG